MKKNNPRIKSIAEITLQDRINAINLIANTYFSEDEDGTILEYTPYLKEVGQVNAIVRYFMDGIEVEDGEDVYSEVMNDSKFKFLVVPFINLELCDENNRIRDFMKNIMHNVEDIVEYKKQENFARIQNESALILNYKMLKLIETEQEKNEKEIEAAENLNRWIEEQRELSSLITPEMQKNFAENFDMNSLMDSIIKKYGESDLYKKNQEVIDANKKIREQERQIIDLQNEFAKREQVESVKNVLADKPKRTRKTTKKTNNA